MRQAKSFQPAVYINELIEKDQQNGQIKALDEVLQPPTYHLDVKDGKTAVMTQIPKPEKG